VPKPYPISLHALPPPSLTPSRNHPLPSPTIHTPSSPTPQPSLRDPQSHPPVRPHHPIQSIPRPSPAHSPSIRFPDSPPHPTTPATHASSAAIRCARPWIRCGWQADWSDSSMRLQGRHRHLSLVDCGWRARSVLGCGCNGVSLAPTPWLGGMFDIPSLGLPIC
jgi:hypothetical protein